MKITNKFFFSIAVLLFLFFSGRAQAAESKLVLDPVVVQSGQLAVMPIIIDEVDKLAGIKIVLKYDSKLLTYEKTEKSNKTSKLMHVVNDKEPGKLIIVMAGAKGVSGKKIDILSISFKAAANIKKKTVTKIKVSEIELVSEQLQTLPCKLSDSEITILPEKN